jgi:hypothetical protein
MVSPDPFRATGNTKSRVMRLRLPTPPQGSVPEGASRQWLVVEAPTHCYIPKVLEQKGLAGYEPEALACFLAATAVARPGAVWDIGARTLARPRRSGG